MGNLKLLGRKIRALRKAKNLTQEKLAELIEMSPRHIVNLENGSNQPAISTLKKIAAALDTSIASLYNNDYYDDPEVLRTKIHDKVDKINDTQLRMLYRVATGLD